MKFFCGRHKVTIWRRGRVFVYNVETHAGLLDRVGIDLLSPDFETAAKGIAARIYGR